MSNALASFSRKASAPVSRQKYVPPVKTDKSNHLNIVRYGTGELFSAILTKGVMQPEKPCTPGFNRVFLEILHSESDDSQRNIDDLWELGFRVIPPGRYYARDIYSDKWEHNSKLYDKTYEVYMCLFHYVGRPDNIKQENKIREHMQLVSKLHSMLLNMIMTRDSKKNFNLKYEAYKANTHDKTVVVQKDPLLFAPLDVFLTDDGATNAILATLPEKTTFHPNTKTVIHSAYNMSLAGTQKWIKPLYSNPPDRGYCPEAILNFGFEVSSHSPTTIVGQRLAFLSEALQDLTSKDKPTDSEGIISTNSIVLAFLHEFGKMIEYEHLTTAQLRYIQRKVNELKVCFITGKDIDTAEFKFFWTNKYPALNERIAAAPIPNSDVVEASEDEFWVPDDTDDIEPDHLFNQNQDFLPSGLLPTFCTDDKTNHNGAVANPTDKKATPDLKVLSKQQPTSPPTKDTPNIVSPAKHTSTSTKSHLRQSSKRDGPTDISTILKKQKK